MRALHRKLLRDLWRLRGQVLDTLGCAVAGKRHARVQAYAKALAAWKLRHPDADAATTP